MADENSFFNTAVSMGGISILAAASRTILSEDKRTFIGFLRGLILAIFVGIIVRMIIQSYSFSPPAQGAIIGVASFVADDILMMVLTISKSIRQRPAIIVEWILRK